MKHLILRRFCYRDDSTFGVFLYRNQPRMLTLEDPWKGNKPFVSCIPPGTYEVAPYSSQHYPDHWQVLDVPDRTNILIHEGNTEIDTKGCILVGSEFGELRGHPAVLKSVKALNALRVMLPERFQLTVEHGGWGFD